MLHFNKMAAVLVSLGALALSGCGSSSDDSSTTNVETAKAAAAASLAKALNAAANSISTVTDNSTATDVVVGKRVKIPLNARTQAEVLNRFKKISASPALRAVTAGRSENGTAALATATATVTEDELKKYFGTATQVGNTITYTLNADAVCDDPYMTVDEETECRETASHITLVQTVVDATTGTLTIKVKTAAPLVIGYAPASVYLEINLAEIKAAAIALDSTSVEEFPATMVGAVRLTVTVSNATAGAESAAVKLGITTAINVAGSGADGTYNLQMAAADKLFEIAADVAAKTATVTVGVGLVHFEFPAYHDVLLAMRPSLFHLGGLTGTFVMDNTTQMLTGTNVGITGDGLHTDDDTSDEFDGSMVTLTPFNFTVNGETSLVTFTTALDFDVTDDYVGTADDGMFSASVDMNTQLLVTNMMNESIMEVTAGSVDITQSGHFGPSFIASPGPDACFTDGDGSSTYDGLAPAPCQ